LRTSEGPITAAILLAFAAMTIESVKQQGVGPGELVSLAKGLTMAFEGLFFDHRAPVTDALMKKGLRRLRRAHTSLAQPV
jgi:hypothetical protein